MRNARVYETPSPKWANRRLNTSAYLPDILSRSNVKFSEGDVRTSATAMRNAETAKVTCKFRETGRESRAFATKRKEEIKTDTPKQKHEVYKEREMEQVWEYRNIMNIPKLSINVLEVWINTTLKDVEISAIPKQYLNIEGKTPISRFGIDREKLLVLFGDL
eukprot:TRINITY_DN1442_c0_g2_i1.p1 TRINITY_DN1442_c0_g2~~TRINITY_DN1442_c0_g2_i1.p1  ORF type:complete len:162 (+),score=25.02 TRINITY_DN1442_c0_g2_i1:184-669(+)